MRERFWIVLSLFVLYAAIGLALMMPSIVVLAQPQFAPTITPMPTVQSHVYYIFEVEIAYRGTSRGVVRTTTIRDKASIKGADMGQYRPYTKWWCDEAIPEGQNVWCKLAAQDAYIPLKYDGVYFTDWRE
jgi:hypothetical protein